MDTTLVALNQYLTFTLDEELFALDIASVREILDMTVITRIPRVPEFMRGVINLRGRAVPVVDLRLKFGLGRTEKTVHTCIIITEVEQDGEKLVVGALADSVQEVFELEPEAIEPSPRMGTAIRAEFIKGMGRRDERFIVILDVNKVFSSEELALLHDGGEPEPAKADAA
jgi:purine-binding chemotaxis protein CheW